MTDLQEFREVETSDQQRSILLVDIMKAIGFSKCERKIHIHHFHLRNALVNSHQTNDKSTIAMKGCTSESMCGGIYNNKNYNDFEFLLTDSNIKLYTPRTNNINNPPLLSLHDNAYYYASFLLKKMTTFQDMSH